MWREAVGQGRFLRKRSETARRFFLVEERRPHVVAAGILNRTRFRGMPLGDLLSRDLEDVLTAARPVAQTSRLRSLASSILHGLRHSSSPRALDARVIMFQTNKRDHLDSISGAVRATAGEVGPVVVVGTEHQQQVNYWDIFGLFGLGDVVRVAALSAWHAPRVSRAVHVSGPSSSALGATLVLVEALARQLLHGLSAKRFLSYQSQLGIVAADFDRGPDTAVVCTAARAVGIPSCSFQHGVLIPSPVASSYSPLVADSIGVWGEAAQTQLVREGVSPDKVTVVGRPMRHGAGTRDSAWERDSSSPRSKVVALALSTPDEIRDRVLVAHLAALREACRNPELSFVVKLHPARRPEDFDWVTSDFALPLVPRHQPRHELMAELAAVLVTNSTFAIDAAASGVPVGVVCLPGVPLGFGQGFVDYLRMPVVRTPEDLNRLILGIPPIDRVALSRVNGEAPEGRIAAFLAKQMLPPREFQPSRRIRDGRLPSSSTSPGWGLSRT